MHLRTYANVTVPQTRTTAPTVLQWTQQYLGGLSSEKQLLSDKATSTYTLAAGMYIACVSYVDNELVIHLNYSWLNYNLLTFFNVLQSHFDLLLLTALVICLSGGALPPHGSILNIFCDLLSLHVMSRRS